MRKGDPTSVERYSGGGVGKNGWGQGSNNVNKKERTTRKD